MPWVRLDDRFPSHRKVALLSDRAFRLHVSALCWCSENLTEGAIRKRELPVIARIRGAAKAAAELEDAGLWDRADDGWMIHDYLEYNPDRARVQSDREANAARQKAFRDRKRAEREAARKAERNAQSNGVTDDRENTDRDTSATLRRHDGDTTAQDLRSENREESQVSEFRNAVSNGPPSPPPPHTSTSFGSTGAASAPNSSGGGLPDALADLKRGVAAAGLNGIAWDLRDAGREYTRQAIDRVGVPAMVAYAVNSARLKGQPAGASAWVQGWRSLEAAPEPQAGVAYLPAAIGAGIPSAIGRQQQETDDWANRAMQRAQARMDQESS